VELDLVHGDVAGAPGAPGHRGAQQGLGGHALGGSSEAGERASPARAGSDGAEHGGLQPDAGNDRQQCRHRGALAAHLGRELRAALAAGNVAAQRGALESGAARRRELLADLDARRLAGAAPARERLARLEDQRLHLLAPHAEDLGDLVVAVVAELEEHERRALLLGEAFEVGQQAAQLGAAVDVGGQAVGGGVTVVEGDLLAPRAQDRQAAVARDGVEPGPEADRPIAGAQRAIGGHEGVLQRVLRLLVAGQHVPAEGEQAAVVAVEDELEGALVAAADTSHEGIVGPPARQAVAQERAPEGAHTG
jgi:hypothetical protein